MLVMDQNRTERAAQPLTIRLAILVLAVVLPAVMVIGGLVWRVGDLDQERANANALQLARNVAADLDRDITGSMETLIALSSAPSVRDGDFREFHRYVSEVLRYRGVHALLRTLDGSQVLNTRVAFGEPLTAVPPSVAEIQAIADRKSIISNLQYGPISKAWVVWISVPVVIADQVRYILSLSLEDAYFRRILESTHRDAGWVIAASDPSGRLIARSDEHPAYVGRIIHPDVKSWSRPPEGVHRTLALAGAEVVRGYRWSAAGWLIAAFVPAAVVEAPGKALWQWFEVLAAGWMLLSLPTAYFLGRRIARPIQAAAKDAYSIGKGQVIARRESSLREANELSAALSTASIELQRRTSALAESEARFRSIFEQSAVGFEQVGLDGRLINVNAFLCSLLGYSREECLERSLEVLTHPDDWRTEEELIAGLLKNERPYYEIEKRLIPKSGKAIWVHVTSTLVRDVGGRPLHRTSVVEDVTERRKAREAQARLAAIVQASNDAMISVSPHGIIETWNPGATGLLGYSKDEAIGKSLAIVVPSDRRNELTQKLALAMKGEIAKIETVRLHKDGTPIDVSSTAAPIWAGGCISSISVTMEDIRDRKRREAHIMLLNRELAHRVKNTLAVIQSIANQTLRSAPTPESFRVAFQGRLQALAAANDLLMQTSWEGTELGAFIDRQLAPLMPRTARQIVKQGPTAVLPSEMTIPLGLALHELGTNAIKYGAWSVPAGKVELTWLIQDGEDGAGRRLILTWVETGGPPVLPPERRGFGATVIERGIPGAIVHREFAREGLKCELNIDFPAEPVSGALGARH